MASATGTRAAPAALLFSFSAVLFLLPLLQAPGLAVADLLASALDRLLDGRGLLELLATRRNMILLCHAIFLLILRDAGVLGAPARRRSRSRSLGEATAVTAAGTDIIACSAAPARPHATRSAVVWRRRPRNRATAPMHDGAAAARRLVECHPAAEAVATWAAPVLTTGPPAQAEEAAAAVATKQIVLVESPRNDEDLLDRHDRTAIVEHPTAIAVDGERDCEHRRVIAVANDEKLVYTAREQQMAGMEMEMEMELADDRTFEEFIKSQRRMMRQESLHYQAIAACY